MLKQQKPPLYWCSSVDVHQERVAALTCMAAETRSDEQNEGFLQLEWKCDFLRQSKSFKSGQMLSYQYTRLQNNWPNRLTLCPRLPHLWPLVFLWCCQTHGFTHYWSVLVVSWCERVMFMLVSDNVWTVFVSEGGRPAHCDRKQCLYSHTCP